MRESCGRACSARRTKSLGLHNQLDLTVTAAPAHTVPPASHHRCATVGRGRQSVRSNLCPDEEAQFKKLARHFLGLSDDALAELLARGGIEEVGRD